MLMENETALITGGTSGIGKKLAERFLLEGCKVAICSRGEDHVTSTVNDLKGSFGDRVIGFPCDVSNMASVLDAVDKTVAAFGSLRILVANAGLNSHYGPFRYFTQDQVAEDAKSVLGANLVGMMNAVHCALPHMLKQKYGRIITLSGGGADRPLEHMTIYSASKGGVLAFSKCLALELKQENADIKINILQPGMQRTGLTTGPTRASMVAGWKSEQEIEKQMAIVLDNLGGDLDLVATKTLPFVLPSCAKSGTVIMGFSLGKLIKGVRKMQKMQTQLEKEHKP
jgi:NAD(P)-dependent dehydrogenase (short-subunit alcohol dehydrogenase family)